MSKFCAMSYEKTRAQQYANEFLRGVGDFCYDNEYYEKYYPGYVGRMVAMKATCMIIRDFVNNLPIDIPVKDARDSVDINWLKDQLSRNGVLDQDIPDDTWLMMLRAEIVPVFLIRRKGYVLNDAEGYEPITDDGSKMIISDEPAIVWFYHKGIPVYMATQPIFSYPYLYYRDRNGEVIDNERMASKQRYFAIINDKVYEDSTKAGIIKCVNRVLRGEPQYDYDA